MVWFIALVLLVGITGAGCSDDSTTTTSSGTPTTEQNQEKPDEKEPTAAKLNQEVKVGNFSYVASEVKTAQTLGNEFLNKKTEEQFILIKVKVTNNDKETRMVDTNLFKLKDDQGREFSADAEADMYVNENNNFFLEQVNPGMSRTGYVVFETPKDVKGLILEVSSGLGWSGGKFASIGIGM